MCYFNLTVPYSNRVISITIPIKFSSCYNGQTNKTPAEMKLCQECTGIVDTGAMCSSVSQMFVEKFHLPVTPSNNIAVSGLQVTHSHACALNIMLPNNIMLHRHTFLVQPMIPDMLLGMDIWSNGSIAITNVGGCTLFTAEFPSRHIVDFVQLSSHQ